MTQTFTIIGDPHVKPTNLDLFKELTEKVELFGNSAIWLGDLLDTKELIRGRCLNAWFEYFATSKLKHVVLVGNHDWFNLECNEHSLNILKTLPNVDVIDTPTYLPTGLGFIPYMHDMDLLKKALRKMPKNTILFGHLEINNFDYGTGIMCTNGLTPTSLKKFKKVISGHFHKYANYKNIMYLGTPFSHSFGESNQTKYLATLTISEEGNPNISLIETTFPRHITVELDCDSKEFPDFIRNIRAGDLVRVILKGAKSSIAAFRREDYANYKIIWIERPSDEAEFSDIADTLSNEKQFELWAKTSGKLDSSTIELGLQILRGSHD